MLGVLINVAIQGGVLHKRASSPQIRAVRSDLALAGRVSVPLRGGVAVQAGLAQLCRRMAFPNLRSLLALGVNPRH